MANGHRFDDVINVYTFDQIQLFYQLAQNRRLNDARLTAVTTRGAFGAKQKDWDKFMKSLEPRDPGEPQEAPADKLVRQLRKTSLWRSLKK